MDQLSEQDIEVGHIKFIISTLVKPLKSKVYKRRTVKFAINM